MTFHTTMLIDSILRAGESANESVSPHPDKTPRLAHR